MDSPAFDIHIWPNQYGGWYWSVAEGDNQIKGYQLMFPRFAVWRAKRKLKTARKKGISLEVRYD